jgi:hypothetical protein
MNAVHFGPGERISLVSTRDPWIRVWPGDEGTVLEVDGDVLRVAWDTGWFMPVYLCPDGDDVELVESAEVSAARRLGKPRRTRHSGGVAHGSAEGRSTRRSATSVRG